MADEREVKTRVTLEKGGDTTAISDTAKELDTLGPAAERAVASVAQFAAAFASGDLERIKAAAVELHTEWDAMGPAIKAAFGEGSAEAAQYQTVLEGIKRGQEGLADPLVASLHEAEDALTKLESDLEQGFEGAAQKVAVARAAVDSYREAIDKAAAAGKDVSGANSGLDQLTQRYGTATQKVGEFRTAQQGAKRDLDSATAAAGGQIQGFTSLGGALQQIGGKFGAVGLAAIACWEALKTGYEVGTKLRGVLNDLTEGGFDRAIQRFSGMTDAANKWVGANESAATSAQRFKNELNILTHNGIETAGLSTQEVHAKVVALGKGLQQSGVDASAAQAGYQKWVEGLGLSKTALDANAKALAEHIKMFVEANKGLADTKFAEIFKLQIQSILDDYDRLGQKADSSIQALADKWGIVSSAAAAAAGPLAETAAGAAAAGAALEAAGTQAAGAAVHIENIGGKIRITNEAAAPAAAAVTAFAGATDESAVAAEKADTGLAELQQRYGHIRDEAEKAKQPIQDFSNVVGGSSSTSAAGAAESAAEKMGKAAAAVDGLAKAQDAAGKTAGAAATGIDGIAKAATAAADGPALPKLKTSLEEIGKATFATDLVAQFGLLGPAANSAADAIIAALQRVSAQAATTAQDLASVANVSGPGGGADSDSGLDVPVGGGEATSGGD